METAKMECAKYREFLQTLEKKVVFQVDNVCFYFRTEKLRLSTIRKQYKIIFQVSGLF